MAGSQERQTRSTSIAHGCTTASQWRFCQGF